MQALAGRTECFAKGVGHGTARADENALAKRSIDRSGKGEAKTLQQRGTQGCKAPAP
jgi:hypothetical protein